MADELGNQVNVGVSQPATGAGANTPPQATSANQTAWENLAAEAQAEAAAAESNQQNQRLWEKLERDDARYKVREQVWQDMFAGRDQSYAKRNMSDYEERIRSGYVDAGVATSAEEWQAEMASRMAGLPGGNRLLSNLQEPYAKFGLALAAVNTATAVGEAWAPALSGRFYLPEQAEQQSVSATAPLIGATLGAIVGGLPGAAIGGGVGTAVKQSVDEYYQGREIDPKMAGLAYSSGAGNAVGELDRFTEAVKRAGATMESDFSKTITDISRQYPISSGNLPYLANLSNANPAEFDRNLKMTDAALTATPALYPLLIQGAGVLGRRDATDLARLSASNGDLPTALAFNAQGNASRDSLEFQVAGYNEIRSSLTTSTQASAIAGTRLSTTVALGTSSDEYGRELSPILAANAQTQASLDRLIAQRMYVARDPNSSQSIRDAALQQAQGYQIQRGEIAAQSAELESQRWQMSFSEHSNWAQSLGSQAQLDITRGLLSGKGYVDLTGPEGGYQAVQGAYASFLTHTADDPGSRISESQRWALRRQANEVQTAAAMQQYQFTVTGPESQTLGGLDIGISASERQRVIASTTGSPLDAFRAGRDEIIGMAEKARELSIELSKSNLLKDDEIAKRRQLNDLDTAQAQLRHDTVASYYAGATSIQQSAVAASTSTYNLDILRYGTGANSQVAIEAQVGALDADIALQGERASRKDLNDQERADARRQLADRLTRREQALISEVDFIPSPELQAGLYRTTGELYRLGRSFLEPGNINDTRIAALGQVGQEISGLNSRVSAIRQRQGGALSPEQSAEFERQRQELLNQQADISYSADTSYFQRLPAEVVGGTSFSMRYMPSPSQVAANLDLHGFGTLAARNFGFFSQRTGAAIINQDDAAGANALATGKEPSSQASNATAQVLARLDQTLRNGINVNVNLKGSDGAVQKTVQRASTGVMRQQVGTGQIPVPGVPL